MHLPDDCLTMIFHKLECSSDRESFGLTCHRWLDIQNTNRKSLQFSCSFSLVHLRSSSPRATLLVNTLHIHRLLTRFQHLEHLSLSGCTELQDSDLSQLQFHGSKLDTLNLDCCFGITDSGILLIASSCPSLTAISLYRCNITDDGLQTLGSRCTSLKRINLAYCPLISDHGIRAISTGCTELEAVKMSCCREVNGTGFIGCPATLRYVDAESCKLTPEGIAGIVSGGGVECLNLSGLSWSDNGAALAPIGLATRLKILNLRMCRTIGNESIIAIARGCPALVEWNLALCHEVKVAGWESIGRSCNKLERLHVNRCRNLCDLSLQALREGCRRLQILYISRSGGFSPTALEVFKMHRGNVEIRDEEVMCIGPDWTLR
ncbi:F-box/LRR-repeat protein 12 [Linum perenne]